MSLQEEIISAQRIMALELRQKLMDLNGPIPLRIRRYLGEYEREFEQGFSPASKSDLIKRLTEVHIAYVGDYHTLRKSQKIPLRLLQDLLLGTFSKKQIIVCVEMFRSDDQEVIDQFMAGMLNEREFLHQIQWDQTWGFNWHRYRKLLTYAAEREITVLGINSKSKGKSNPMRLRDRHAARVIAKTSRKNPDALVLVHIGDAHVGRSHLPAEVDRKLGRKEIVRSSLVVHQNVDSIYWELVKQKKEQSVDLVQLDDGDFCVINSTPIMKHQSDMNHRQAREEFACEEHPVWCEIGGNELHPIDQIIPLIRSICGFLDIPVPGIGGLEVYTSHHLDVLARFGDELNNPDAMKLIRAQILRSNIAYIPSAKVLYLATLRLDHAAQGASHFIHSQYGRLRHPFQRKGIELFYFLVMWETLGFFGSKVINHKRNTLHPPDYKRIRKEFRTLKSPSATVRRANKSAYWVLKHKEMEQRYLRDGQWHGSASFARLPAHRKVRIARSLGFMLGNRLYHAVVQEQISKSDLRQLYFSSFSSRRSALTAYQSMILKLQKLEMPFKSQDEQM